MIRSLKKQSLLSFYHSKIRARRLDLNEATPHAWKKNRSTESRVVSKSDLMSYDETLKEADNNVRFVNCHHLYVLWLIIMCRNFSYHGVIYANANYFNFPIFIDFQDLQITIQDLLNRMNDIDLKESNILDRLERVERFTERFTKARPKISQKKSVKKISTSAAKGVKKKIMILQPFHKWSLIHANVDTVLRKLKIF